jgi:hypothetical protein
MGPWDQETFLANQSLPPLIQLIMVQKTVWKIDLKKISVWKISPRKGHFNRELEF